MSSRYSVTTPAGVLTIVQSYAYLSDESPEATPYVTVPEPPYALLNDKPITRKRAYEILAGMVKRLGPDTTGATAGGNAVTRSSA